MLAVLTNAWALLFGLLLLMIGNGLQGTLLGVRGSLEGFSAGTMSLVMSAYFLGMLIGSRVSGHLIRRVGHVRVFAALASLISAGFILYAAIPHPISWGIMRLMVGFCFAGVYIVSESWLNESATNETRGQALSMYVMVQMVGVISAQLLLNVADPTGYTLFVVISVLVSVSVAPILLSATPAPVFEAAKPMSLKQLYEASPLGMVGMFALGGVLSAIFGMSAIFATEAGFSAAETSIFVALIYAGGLILQYPIGWLSDRMDRRVLIAGSTALGAAVVFASIPMLDSFTVVCIAGFMVGGVANPLYALLIAYTNDFLEHEDMAAASGGLMFANGLGAISGPLLIGVLMDRFGTWTFFGFTGALMAAIAVYAVYRMSRRAAPSSEETSAYVPVLSQASPVAVEIAQEYAVEMALEEEEIEADELEREKAEMGA